MGQETVAQSRLSNTAQRPHLPLPTNLRVDGCIGGPRCQTERDNTVRGVIAVLVSGTGGTEGAISSNSMACYLNSCGFTLQSRIFSHRYVIPKMVLIPDKL